MNKQEAYEIAKKAELKKILNQIEDAAQSGEYSKRLKISDREIIYELNELGFNCGFIEDVDNAEIWHIDWSD